jgi:hypothetical protein
MIGQRANSEENEIMNLKDYPTGTIIKIGDRRFEKVQPTTFWREIHDVPGNCVTRPSVSLEGIEQREGVKHVVIQ